MLLENLKNPYELGYTINIPFWTGAWYSPFAIKKVAILFRGQGTSLVGTLNKKRKSIQDIFIIPNDYIAPTREKATSLRNHLMPKSMDLVVILDTKQLQWTYTNSQVSSWTTYINDRPVVLGSVVKRVRDDVIVDICGEIEYRIKANGVLVVNETENIVRNEDTSRYTINYDIRAGYSREIPVEKVIFGDHFTFFGNKFGVRLVPNEWVFEHPAQILDHVYSIVNHEKVWMRDINDPCTAYKVQKSIPTKPLYLDKDTGHIKNIKGEVDNTFFRDLIW